MQESIVHFRADLIIFIQLGHWKLNIYFAEHDNQTWLTNIEMISKLELTARFEEKSSHRVQGSSTPFIYKNSKRSNVA